MPSLKDLKNRIASVKSTQKITKAMQMVAAAKLRRAQDAVEASRPYSERIERVLAALAESLKHDPMAPRLLVGTGEEKTHLLIVATAERGLCGAFNASIVRMARERIDLLRLEGKEVKILCVGRKGREMLERNYGALIIDKIDLAGVKRIEFSDAGKIARKIMARFDEDEFDVCTLFFARFRSVISQVPTAHQLIPAKVSADYLEGQSGPFTAQSGGPIDSQTSVTPDLKGALYEYEPDEAAIVAGLLPLNLSAQIFRALLENAASEQGARMSAMDNASRNAGEMIDNLTLQYNRTRQAAITTELVEIISGAEAL